MHYERYKPDMNDLKEIEWRSQQPVKIELEAKE